MSSEAIAAMVVFAGLFLAWVVVPSYLKKRHEARAKGEDAGADQA